MKETILKSLVGSWRGNCRTWFEPGKLADESEITGAFEPILGGLFVRHAYQGTINERPRHGEETLAFNAATGLFQSSWVDDFHMSSAIMFSHEGAVQEGFQVTGKYDAGPDSPPWSWRTEFKLIDQDQLTITAYKITPDGIEAKALETTYRRANAAGEH